MRRSVNSLSKFNRDDSGAVLIWASVLILVIVALLGLAIDGARYMHLNSNMQQIADAAALAGAKELDGSSLSMTNATNAANAYLKNVPGWSDDGSTATTQISSVKFFETAALAASDSNALPNNDTGNQKAAYIKVTTINRGVATTFARIFGKSQALTSASAIARVTYTICRPVQAFLCNPWETDQPADDRGRAANFTGKVNPGDLFKLGAGSGSGPGNWGFISPVDPTGPPRAAKDIELQNFWSTDTQGTCSNIEVSKLGPYTATGASVGPKASAGMNVRFDVPNYNTDKTIATVPNVRAPVVTDGFIITPNSGSASCASTKSANDQVYATNVSTGSTGTGSSKKDNYNSSSCQYAPVTTSSDTSYQAFCNARVASGPPVGSNVNCKAGSVNCTPIGSNCSTLTASPTRTLAIGSCPLPRDPDMTADSPSWQNVVKGKGASLADLQAYWSNHHTAGYPSGVTTRYGLYQVEVANLGKSGYFDVSGWQTNSTEPPANSCSTSGVGGADRRLLSIAIVDCSYWSINGTSDRLPVVTKTATFFMTEQANANGEIYAEYVNSYDANQDGGSVFQQVELVK